jgi:hypothetical protein
MTCRFKCSFYIHLVLFNLLEKNVKDTLIRFEQCLRNYCFVPSRKKKSLFQLEGHVVLLERLSAVHVCKKLHSCAESERCSVHKVWPLYPVIGKFSLFSRFVVLSCLSSLMLSAKLRTKISRAVASPKAPRSELCTNWSFCKNAVCMLCIFCPCCPGLWNLVGTSGCVFVLRHTARSNRSVLSKHLHCFLKATFGIFCLSVHLLWMSGSI